MKLKKSTLLSRLCAAGVAIFGFGCTSYEPGDDTIICMYGAPTGSFRIKGKVTSEEGKSVPGATIKVTDPEVGSGMWSYKETVTGMNGEYEVESDYVNSGNMKVVCLPDDSGLDADSLVVKMEYKGKDKDNAWYIGHADATVDFKLKKKSE